MMHAISAEITVRTSLDRGQAKPAPSCTRVTVLRSRKRDENGNFVYIDREERDVKSYVNSFKNGASLESVLARVGLMPIRDKIAYLQQTETVSGDMSHVPTDGTAAFLSIQKAAKDYPEVFERISRGESFEAVLKDIFKNAEEKPNNDKASDDPARSEEKGAE